MHVSYRYHQSTVKHRRSPIHYFLLVFTSWLIHEWMNEQMNTFWMEKREWIQVICSTRFTARLFLLFQFAFWYFTNLPQSYRHHVFIPNLSYWPSNVNFSVLHVRFVLIKYCYATSPNHLCLCIRHRKSNIATVSTDISSITELRAKSQLDKLTCHLEVPPPSNNCVITPSLLRQRERPKSHIFLTCFNQVDLDDVIIKRVDVINKIFLLYFLIYGKNKKNYNSMS